MTIDLIIICGPSGAGKNTLIKQLIKVYENDIQFSVSHTTRAPRNGEVEGMAYYFVDKMEKDDFYEIIQYTDKFYGTSKSEIDKIIRNGKVPILDINIDSLPLLREHENLKMFKIFVQAKNLKVLENRLRKRGDMGEEEICMRLEIAKEELNKANKEEFDLRIENEELEKSMEVLKEFIDPIIKRSNEYKNKKSKENSEVNGTLNAYADVPTSANVDEIDDLIKNTKICSLL